MRKAFKFMMEHSKFEDTEYISKEEQLSYKKTKNIFLK